MFLGRRFQNKSCNISLLIKSGSWFHQSHGVAVTNRIWPHWRTFRITFCLASPSLIIYIKKNCIKHTLITDLSEDWGVPEGITAHAELISLEGGVLKAHNWSQLLTEHLMVGSGAKGPERDGHGGTPERVGQKTSSALLNVLSCSREGNPCCHEFKRRDKSFLFTVCSWTSPNILLVSGVFN